MKAWRQAAAFLLVLCCCFVVGFSVFASACTYTSEPTKVGRNFSAQVVHNDKPLAGIQVQLSTVPNGDEESRSVVTISTDDRGLSKFSNIKPGLYYLGIKHAAFPQSVEILVASHRAKVTTEKITFEWPGMKPLSVRFVSGLLNAVIRTENPLNDQARPTFGALGGAKLTLSRSVSGEVVEAQMATESGGFGFQAVVAGLYTLHVEMPKDGSRYWGSQDGYVPIEIDPSAKISSLNLFLYPGICGSLGYENRQETPTE